MSTRQGNGTSEKKKKQAIATAHVQCTSPQRSVEVGWDGRDAVFWKHWVSVWKVKALSRVWTLHQTENPSQDLTRSKTLPCDLARFLPPDVGGLMRNCEPWKCQRLKSSWSSVGSVFIISALMRGKCVKSSTELTEVRWGFSLKAAAIYNHGLSSLSGTLTFYPDSPSHLYPGVPARFSLLQSDSCTLAQSNMLFSWGQRSLITDCKHRWGWRIFNPN